MKAIKFCSKLFQSQLTVILGASFLFSSSTAIAAIQQAPNNLIEGVAPNMLLTLDDSGSMARAFAPDNISGTRNTRRAKSSDFNPIYYNPEVEYEIPPFYDSNGRFEQLTTSFTTAYHNGFLKNKGSINLNNQYRADWSSGVNAPTDSTVAHKGYVAAYYYKFDRSKSGCSNFDSKKTDDNCYSLVDVSKESSEQKQNFAIWYSFYRNRALATLSAAATAFSDLSSGVRFSWQALNKCQGFDNKISCNNNKFLNFGSAHKGNFYTWLKTMPFSGGTPLRVSMQRAGEFLKTEKAWNKYLDGSGTNSDENRYACRPSYHILMTDGVWNGNRPSNIANHDNKNMSLPDGKNYSTRAPYKDSTSNNNLADVAFHYWATDLGKNVSGLKGNHKVPQFMPYKSGNDDADYWNPRNNPATWQHMSNFIVGLALTNSLNHSGLQWEGSTFAGQAYQNLLSGDKSWPKASSNSNNNVYDLWHAAINSRGEFYSVESPEAMVKAFKDILSRIADRQSTAALPSMSYSTEESSGLFESYSYATSFDSTDWSGDVVKSKRVIEADGKVVTSEVWSAKAELKDKLVKEGYTSRKINMVVGNTLKPFEFNNLSPAQKTLLHRNPETGNSDNKGSQRLDYIKGDPSNEGTAANKFRQRSSVLGDFLDSAPVVVTGSRYMVATANSIENNTKYTQFTSDNLSRHGRLYVGGNAGMLHAFDTSNGKETFAFVPSATFENLHKLTDPKYGHHYFVNGSPVVNDVFYDGEWHTVLVGTLGAGGKGIFALDISNPDTSSDTDGIKLLWEKGEEDFDGVKLGYTFSQPTIARLHNGRWAAVFGNGYESETRDGRAALYIVDIQTGELVKSLVVQGEAGVRNGLSTPRLVDFDGDGVADYAYAGDLQGNMWRFDLFGDNHGGVAADTPLFGNKNGSSNNFKVSFGGNPMFKAAGAGGQKQAITTKPALVLHPNGRGYIVVFGTGKYFEVEDKGGADSFAQSMYGIWDKNVSGTSTALVTPTAKRSTLAQQSIVQQLFGTNDYLGITREARTITGNPAGWDSHDGWVLDLNVPSSSFDGEMIVDSNAIISFDKLLIAQSLVPSDDPCAHGAGYWTYFINPATGGRFERHVIDTYVDADMPFVSAVKMGTPGGILPTFDDKGRLVIGNPDGEGAGDEYRGRQTWRLVPDP